MKLNWGMWIYGLFAALIGGGAGAGAAALGAMGLTPGQYGVTGNGGWNSLKLMGVTFAITGVTSAFAYLSKSPLPAIETTVSTALTTQPGSPPQMTTTVSEKRTEPKP